ncbi:MAG: hypothetical protein ACOYI4_07810, partial [Christensenellales bacterium]|jgi:hypothetical protein
LIQRPGGSNKTPFVGASLLVGKGQEETSLFCALYWNIQRTKNSYRLSGAFQLAIPIFANHLRLYYNKTKLQ